jgi:SSS family solute:Na+ symporter
LKFLPSWTNGAFPDYPFLDRMTITFVLIVAVMISMSLIWPRKPGKGEPVVIESSMFRVSPVFMVGSVIILGILAALYTVFW